jgi:amino acid transporter
VLVAPLRIGGLTRTMWLGFGINALSGVALLLAYPAKALTNWVFYLKMALVLVGVYVAARIARELAPAGGAPALPGAFHARRWATASLLVWAAAIVTGRLLAYTHSVLFASELP